MDSFMDPFIVPLETPSSPTNAPITLTAPTTPTSITATAVATETEAATETAEAVPSVSYPIHKPERATRPFSAFALYNDASDLSKFQRDVPRQRPFTISHRASVSSFMTTATSNYSITTATYGNGDTHPGSQINLHRQTMSKSAMKQQLKQQQRVKHKPTLLLFPTERTRGASSIQDALKPVDITKIELLPIEFSHQVIMSCIEEIKLRGLEHKYLFRNPFYSPSVEVALKLLLDPKKSHLFSVKMMRIDTVGGLLTTVLSRTFPPLIPPAIHELFQEPNGHFFFELLSMLPELNRFLFVEILELCCMLADNQIYNHVSNSKLSIYPGSCCFGLDEYMPTWDTRYLLASDIKKSSSAFYNVIYAYREERDLSEQQLQQKLETRDRIVAEKRLEALELEYGLEGAHEFLKRETRIAKGLPPDSPEVVSSLPLDIKEVSLYADRKEHVVADDNISVFDMELDDGADAAAPASAKAKTFASNSITTNRFNSPFYSRITAARNSSAPAYRRPRMTRSKSSARFGSIAQNIYPVSPSDIFGTSRHAIERRELQNFLSIARTTKKRRSHSSKRTLQLRLQTKLFQQFPSSSTAAVSRSSSSSLLLSSSTVFSVGPSTSHTDATVRTKSQHPTQRYPRGSYHRHTHQYPITNLQSKTSMATDPSLRRTRTRQLRKDLQVYMARGLSRDEAMAQREVDIKKQRRREKRAKKIAIAKAEVEARAELERRAAAAAAAEAARVAAEAARVAADVTMEEAEVLEAFDYLTDQEFSDFMELAGLSMLDVERIREKAAAAALSQVTKDIQSVGGDVKLAVAETPVVVTDAVAAAAVLDTVQQYTEDVTVDAVETVIWTIPVPGTSLTTKAKAASMATTPPPSPPTTSTATARIAKSAEPEPEPMFVRQRQPISISHMTSMDLLIKNTAMIGDSNLRCYPPQLPTPENSVEDVSHGGQFSRVIDTAKGTLTQEHDRARRSEDSTTSSIETVVSVGESLTGAKDLSFPNVKSIQVTKAIAVIQPVAVANVLTPAIELKRESVALTKARSQIEPATIVISKPVVGVKQGSPVAPKAVPQVELNAATATIKPVVEVKQQMLAHKATSEAQPAAAATTPIIELKEEGTITKSLPQIQVAAADIPKSLNSESKLEPVARKALPQPKVYSRRPSSPHQTTELRQDPSVTTKSQQLQNQSQTQTQLHTKPIGQRPASPKVIAETRQEPIARTKIPQPKVSGAHRSVVPEAAKPEPAKQVQQQRKATVSPKVLSPQPSKTASQRTTAVATVDMGASTLTPETTRGQVGAKILPPIPKSASARTTSVSKPLPQTPTEMNQDLNTIRTKGLAQLRPNNLRTTVAKPGTSTYSSPTPATDRSPATTPTPASSRASGGVSALKNMFEVTPRSIKSEVGTPAIANGVSARKKLFEATQQQQQLQQRRPTSMVKTGTTAPVAGIRSNAATSRPTSTPTSIRIVASTPAPAPARASASAIAPSSTPALASTPAPAPAPVSAPTKVVPVPKSTIVASTASDMAEEQLQLLDVDSDDEEDMPVSGKESDKDGSSRGVTTHALDEEAAELQELLAAMTEEERQEFMRLS
ncbi:hypothetical protein BGZ98_005063 [Dissophora globulifera]|nr:hypothetical protein BGZ98_005063 [Dissophora globulifera]